MISKTMCAKLNEQITAEFMAAHKYLAMACVFDQMGFKILAERFMQQHEEERRHGMKFVQYLQDMSAPVQLEAINQPKSDFKTPEAIVQAALDGELDITRRIHELVALADAEKDYATRSFLNWFVDEQVEEVSSMMQLLNLFRLAGNNVLQVEARVHHEMASKK